jgi:hypothetical protein
MKTSLIGVAVAALLVFGSTLPGFAEDPPAPQAPADQTEAPSPAVARPAIVPKAETAAPAANANAAPSHRRYAHYRHRYGYYRTAYWEPFPILWPHFYHSRIHWNRIPWLFRF